VLPVLFEGQVKAVIELASLGAFTALQLSFLDQLTIVDRHRAQFHRGDHANRRFAQTVANSWRPSLQTQQRELQQTNEQLEPKAQQLADRNVEVEAKNQEIEERGARSKRRRRNWH